MTRLAILCPGQGGQHAQMFELIDPQHYANHCVAWQLERKLGAPLDTVLRDADALFDNRHAQPLIVAASAMMWLALKNALPAPSVVAGYSIGELSACVVAGSLAADDAVDLAFRRARMMDACVSDAHSQGLLAISDLPVHALGQCLREHDVYVAIETAEDSLIAGGYHGDLLALQEQLQTNGARCSLLPVKVASHTPLMHDAVAPFAQALDKVDIADPQTVILSGISAQSVHTRSALLDCLPRQIAETIRWRECMDALAEAGVDIALELGPGCALSRMMRARHPYIECRSVAEFRTVAGIAAWIERHA